MKELNEEEKDLNTVIEEDEDERSINESDMSHNIVKSP